MYLMGEELRHKAEQGIWGEVWKHNEFLDEKVMTYNAIWGKVLNGFINVKWIVEDEIKLWDEK